MTNNHLFWFAAGAMTAVAALLLSLPVFKHLSARYSATRVGAIVTGALVLTIGAALGLYRMWGSPGAISLSAKETALVSTMAHPGPGTDVPAAGTDKIGSVEEATAKLAQRMHSTGGTRAEWNLLAQSYDYMGRPDDAAEARKLAGSAGSPAVAGTIAATVSVQGTALLAQAEKFRIVHDYATALDRYKQAAKLNALDADAWANYADAAASSNGKLDGPPGQYLAHALQLDPDHPKALWLQASLMHEQKRYAEAVEVWRHLAKVLPPDSPDARIIAANVAEALRLSVSAAPHAAAATPPAGAAAQISGTIDIDPKLRAKASSGLTLFVFAKSTDSPGPPLAVVRTTVDQWPVKFQLNDSQAMMPQRKLSDFHAVKVEARISANGQPLAQPGDMQGTSGTLDPKSDKPVHLVIREVIG